MTNRKGKRYLCSVMLAGVMLFTVCARPVLAEEDVQPPDIAEPSEGLCEHHTAHDGACGYAEGNPDTPCGYVCSQCTEETGTQPGAEETGRQPGEEETGTQPGAKETGIQPGAEETGNRPEAEKTGDQPGAEKTGNQPGTEESGTQPGEEETGGQPEEEETGNQAGAEETGNRPEAEETGDQPGEEKTGNQPGTEESGTQPGEEETGGQPGEEKTGNQPDGEEADFSEPLLYSAGAADGGDKSGGFIFNQSHYDPSVSGPAVLPETETVYTAGSGQIIWTPNLDADGKVVSGRLTLKDAEINNSSSNPEVNYGSGIWMPVPFELVLEGDNRITAAGYGIMLPDADHSGTYDLAVRGSGSLTINSQHPGIWTDGTVTLDGADVTVNYGFASGILSEYGDVVIQNDSHVTVKSSDAAVSSGSAVNTNNRGDIIIKDSHVTVLNRVGGAVHAIGDVRFENSEVRTLGAGIVVCSGNGKTFTMSGGSWYTKYTGSGTGYYDIELGSKSPKLENSAVIYCGGPYNYLVQQGDSIQYANCIYDEPTDQITSVGAGSVYGNVNWNQYIRFPQGQNQWLRVGPGGSTLTIPEGVTAEIPGGATLRNSYSGAEAGMLINYGTLNVLDGGTLYNYDEAGGNHGVVTRNEGVINLSPQAVFFNSASLENSGTINAEGTLCNVQVNYNGDRYNGVIQNTGTIHGLVNVRADGQVLYRAEGTAVLKNGQTLTLGAGTANNGQWETALEIPAGGSLTVAEGAVVDAKTNVTKDTLSAYLKAGDTLVVDGILLLPEDVPQSELEVLAERLAGKGTVKTGDIINHIITFDKGDGTVQKELLAAGSQIVLPLDPVRDGYLFEGWYINKDGNEAAAGSSMTADGNLTIYAKWKAVDTGGDDKPGGEDQPGDDKPGGDDEPGDDKPGGDGKPGDDKPGEDGKPGDDKPGEDGKPGDDKPGGDGKPGDNQPGGDGKPGDNQPGGDGKPGDNQPGGSDTGNEEKPGGGGTDQNHNSGGGSGSGGSSTGSSDNASGGNGAPVSSQDAAAAVVTGDASDPGVWVLGLACSLVFLTGILKRFYRIDL